MKTIWFSIKTTKFNIALITGIVYLISMTASADWLTILMPVYLWAIPRIL